MKRFSDIRSAARHMGYALVCLCVLAGVFSCADPYRETIHGSQHGKVRVIFGSAAPRSLTRALSDNEYSLHEVNVLVFRNNIFLQNVQATALAGADGRYTFEVQLDYSDDPVTLVILGNSHDILQAASLEPKRITYEGVKATLAGDFTDYADITGTEYFPMFGQITLDEITKTTTVENVRLIRSFARVGITMTEELEEEYNVEEIYGYRLPEEFLLFPAQGVDGNTDPNLSSTGAILSSPVTNSDSPLSIYLPEAGAVSDPDEAACIVVGISPVATGQLSYYRIDLKDEGGTGRIIRNRDYTVTITGITAGGEATADDAARSATPQLTTDFIDWEDDGSNTIYDRNGNFISLSSRDFSLHFYEGAYDKVTVVNTLTAEYTLEFADGRGLRCHYGESIKDPRERFEVEISPDGSTITVTALEDNEDGMNTHGAELIGRIANITFPMHITQDTRMMRDYVLVFNLTGIEGAIGDEMINVYEGGAKNWPVAGKKLSDLLKNETNYGFNGTVPFQGFRIGGPVYQNKIVPALIEMFDVVYLPFSADHGKQNTDAGVVFDLQTSMLIRDWLSESGKVLMTYCSNKFMLQSLGVIASDKIGSTSGQYRIADDAPDFILNGPFGVLQAGKNIGFSAPSADLYTISMSQAQSNNITPVILSAANNEVVIGVDLDRRVVYLNDYIMYNAQWSTMLTGDGRVESDIDKVIANLWAWVAKTALGDY